MLVSIWMERLFTLVVVHLNKNIFRKHETHLITLRRSEHGSKTGKMVKKNHSYVLSSSSRSM